MQMTDRIAMIGMLLALVVLTVPASGAQEGPPPATVQVGFAIEQEMAPHTWVPATVASRNFAAIASEVAGQLTWVAEVGDRIEQGQPVARINDQSLQLQLKNDIATIKRLEAQLEYLDQQVERLQRLSDQKVVAASELEEARTQSQAAQQELVQAKIAKERTLYELSRTRVKAPFTGEVVERLQQPGSYSGIGEEIVHLVDAGSIEVLAQAPLSVAPFLSEGMAVTVKNPTREVAGQIRRIIPVGDQRSRMFEVRIAVGKESWIVGTAVRVALPNAESRRVITVPRDALILRSEGIYVFKVTGDGTAERILVETGMGEASLIEVRGNVAGGDKVVVRGGERLQPGQSVEVSSGSHGSPAG
jgi:RND family efflux transporter MFP subunit